MRQLLKRYLDMSAILDESQLPRKRAKRALSVSEKETIINIYIASRERDPTETRTEHVAFVSRASVCFQEHQLAVYIKFWHKRSNFLFPPKGDHRARAVLDNVSQETKALIRRKIHEFFFRNEPPKLDKILLSVNDNDDDNFPNFKRSTLATNKGT